VRCCNDALQYYVRLVSEDWLHAEAMLPLSFVGLILPERMPPHTGASVRCMACCSNATMA
jgi:hypothetical protein